MDAGERANKCLPAAATTHSLKAKNVKNKKVISLYSSNKAGLRILFQCSLLNFHVFLTDLAIQQPLLQNQELGV